MDEGTKYRVPIGDACVSMRVCFDSLCFSSSQPPHADEEEEDEAAAVGGAAAATSTQLPRDGGAAAVASGASGLLAVATTVTTTQVTQVPHGGGALAMGTVATMGTLRELQELLRSKDERIAELEAVVCCRDAEIQELRSHLDKFLSVLPFSAAPPLTPTKPRTRDRAQGISAEPPLQELAPLAVVDKSDRLVPRATVFLPRALLQFLKSVSIAAIFSTCRRDSSASSDAKRRGALAESRAITRHPNEELLEGGCVSTGRGPVNFESMRSARLQFGATSARSFRPAVIFPSDNDRAAPASVFGTSVPVAASGRVAYDVNDSIRRERARHVTRPRARLRANGPFSPSSSKIPLLAEVDTFARERPIIPDRPYLRCFER